MLHVCDSENCPCWLLFVKQLLNNLEFGYIWDWQECFNENLFLHEVKQRLNDWFIQEAHSFFESSLKCNLYNYLNKRFQLQLERGRFFDIDRSERICKHCSLGNVEYEFRFISFWSVLFMKDLKKNISKNTITKNLLHWNLFNYSLQKISQIYVHLGNIFIDVQSLIERKTHLYLYSNYY